jgi:hypothetical protein
MKLLLIALSTFLVSGTMFPPPTSQAQEATDMIKVFTPGEPVRLDGTIQNVSSPEGDWISINLENPIACETTEGETLTVRTLQLANIQPDQWQATKALAGQPARVIGRLMERNTVHHKTPMLVLVQSIQPVPEP